MSMFSTLWTVMCKELLDLSRDKRTLMLTLLLGPLLYPVLILGMGALAEKRVSTQIDKPLEIPVIGREHAPNLVEFLASQGLTAVDAPADLAAAIANQEVDVALEISKDFQTDWEQGRPALVEVIIDTTRRSAEIPGRRVESVLSAYSQQVGALRLLARGIDPSVVRALDVATREQASAEARRGVMLSLMLPVLLTMTSFLGGAYLIMDATAGERERQSLEPLLATPAPRSAILSGKIAAACAVGLASLLLTLVAFKLSAVLSTSGVGKQLNMGFVSMVQMLLIMLPMLLIGTSLLTFLSAASKSMKEAQSHMTWLMLLPMLPGYALMVYPLKSELWQFAVPFLSQNQMLLKVIRHEPIDVQTWAIYLVCAVGLAAVLWYAALRRYHQERLAISG